MFIVNYETWVAVCNAYESIHKKAEDKMQRCPDANRQITNGFESTAIRIDRQ